MRRRHFLQLAASAAAGAVVDRVSPASAGLVSLRIAPTSVELAPGIVVTTGYHRLRSTATVTNMAAVGISGWISQDGRNEVIHVLLENGPSEPWSYPEIEWARLEPRRRYRLRMMNSTSSDLSVHLPGRPVELTRVEQSPIAGIFTNNIRLSRYSVIDADLIAGA